MDEPAVANRSVILVVEDDAQIRRVVTTSLGAFGYELHAAQTGQEGLELAHRHEPDLVILDLGLPDMEGLGLIGALRRHARQEILVLSARDSEEVKVRALDLGADDYLAKPFGLYELLARVRVALRRAQLGARHEERVELGHIGVTIDITHRRVTRNEQDIHLTPIEYRLLTTLARHHGKILTHEQLLAEVWGEGHEKDVQYLRIYLGGLRKKLEPDSARPRALLTVPGVGYRLALDSGRSDEEPG